MVLVKAATAMLAILASIAHAVDIAVSGNGGNKTSEIPYGLMHEVHLIDTFSLAT
jgi:hypothetical protein